MNGFQVRTDLAFGAKESVSDAKDEVRGVRVEEKNDEEHHIKVTKVMIDTRNASKDLGKPMGTYITIEAPEMLESDEGYHREISECLSRELREIIPNVGNEQSVLVVGLGNRDVTADALGPHVVDNLFITRHIVKEYGKAAYNCSHMKLISSIEPGVMAKTGMETAEIVKGVVEQTVPEVMIVIDALASRSIKRLNRTIQISDTGIWPGSGVGNHRGAMTQESMGIPVIAIGVPTVVSATTIVNDVLESMLKDIGESMPKSGFQGNFAELHHMYVTSKDIDAVVKRLSFTVSEGINLALEMTEEVMDK